jgi:protocatechuate 3,4-dioxygenase, beta subunit
MPKYSIADLSRREILKMTSVIATAGTASVSTPVLAQPKLPRTPGQILGPFYPVGAKAAQTTDLTLIQGRGGPAQGQVLYVGGRVLNLAGEPVRNAEIEIWQANKNGRYTHPSDDNPAPLDPSFGGFAVFKTDADGRYRFKTIKPGGYPAGPNLIRPPHIHFQVTGQTDRLVTQMYFENEKFNETDPFLNSAPAKALLVTKLLPPNSDLEPGSKQVTFDIVLVTG